MSDSIYVSEVFGPTIQGEGMYTGMICSFIRTSGCDNNCKRCDTEYAQEMKTTDKRAVMEVCDEVDSHKTEHVIVTGGNPAIQDNLDKLIMTLKNKQKTVHVETQGTKWNTGLLHADVITISPKPPSTNNLLRIDKLRMFIDRLKCSYEKLQLKVVVWDCTDIEYARSVHHQFPKIPFILQVGNDVLEDGIDRDTVRWRLLQKYEDLIDNIIHDSVHDDSFLNVRVLPQMHTLLHGNKKGV